MKKVVPSIALFSLVALGGVLLITNPNEADYARYLSSTVADEVEASVCQPEGFSEWLGRVGEAISKACQGVVAGSESLTAEEVQDLIVTNTERKNRLLFSTYETETPFGNYKAIGFLDRFMLQEQTEEVESI